MGTLAFFSRFACRGFAANARGSVAIIYALAIIPLVAAAGVAIDLARANVITTRLQSALDAAALAAAASTKLADNERVAMAEATFAANFAAGYTSGIAATPQVSINAGTVTMSATVTYPTAFMRIVGIDNTTVGGRVDVEVPQGRKAEIAMALDYSGSMNQYSGGKVKYKAMRDAAIALIDDLGQHGKNKDVRFALAPFSHHVRVTLPAAAVLGQGSTGAWTGCTQDRMAPYNLTDSAPVSTIPASQWGHPQAPVHIKQGCAGYASRSLLVQPMSDDHEATIDQLKDMRPYAWTHISLGFSFAWHLVSPSAPFTNVAPYGDNNTMKVIILLTDGRQTEPAFGPGGSRTLADGENNLEKLCANAKAAGVTVVTVAFDLKHKATEDRLRNCSSDPAKYFFIAEDGAALAGAFEQITSALKQAIYISR